MSAYADRFKQKDEQLPLTIAALDFMVDVCPSVRDILLGVIDEAGIQLVKPASITIWVDGNRLKFVINPKDSQEKGWGIISDARHLWEALEKAVLKDEIDWKESKSSDTWVEKHYTK